MSAHRLSSVPMLINFRSHIASAPYFQSWLGLIPSSKAASIPFLAYLKALVRTFSSWSDPHMCTWGAFFDIPPHIALPTGFDWLESSFIPVNTSGYLRNDSNDVFFPNFPTYYTVPAIPYSVRATQCPLLTTQSPYIPSGLSETPRLSLGELFARDRVLRRLLRIQDMYRRTHIVQTHHTLPLSTDRRGRSHHLILKPRARLIWARSHCPSIIMALLLHLIFPLYHCLPVSCCTYSNLIVINLNLSASRCHCQPSAAMSTESGVQCYIRM